jgi:hypothetical protein
MVKVKKIMVIKVDAQETLKRMSYDINTMISNNAEPAIVLRMIRRKLSYLEKVKPYYKVHWWNEEPRRRKSVKVLKLDEDVDDDLIIDGVTKY